MAEIRLSTFNEIESCKELVGLIEEYALECAIDGLPEPRGSMATYKVMEAMGALIPIGVFDGVKLVGFLGVLVYEVPHYGKKMGVVESFFITKSYRVGGLGFRLIKFAEQLAKDQGALGILFSAPIGGALDSVMGKIGYKPVSRIHFKAFV